MARMVQECDLHAAKCYNIAIMQRTVYLDRREQCALAAKQKIRIATIFHHHTVLFVYHDLRAGHFFHARHATHVVEMGLRGEQYFNVGKPEPEFLHVRTYHRYCGV